ncbi:MAG: efflux RND transporter periplasmic adaptor subunit [Maricaulaceae bacterium]
MTHDIGSIPEKRERGAVGWALLIGIPIVLIAGSYILAKVIIKAYEKPEERKRSFNTLSVLADYARTDDVQLMVNVQGEVRPQIEINLVPQVGGQIVKVSPNFIQGGIFKKGETLIEIEAADFEISIIRAEADVAQAEQNLVREIAEGDLARKDFEELLSGTASSLALREPQRAQAEAAVKAAKGQLLAAKLQLERTKVKAPFDGRVRSKTSDIGQFVSPGAALGQIFSTDVVEVTLPLTDDDLYKVNLPLAYVADKRSNAPEVELSTTIAGKRRYWKGRVMRTDSVINTQTRGLSAIVEVTDPYDTGMSEDGVPLAPGLFVEAAINGREFKDVIVIPRDGLRPQNQVYLADNKGKVEIRTVSVLDTNSERAVISEGIRDGELVVLSPMEPSRTSLTLKVSDANDPTILLVDPPQPEWFKKESAEKEEKKSKLDEWRKKKSKKDGTEAKLLKKSGDDKAVKKPRPDGDKRKRSEKTPE